MTVTDTRAAPDKALRSLAAVFFVHGLLFASWTAHIPQIKTHLGIDLGLMGVALLAAPAGSVLAMSASAHLVPTFGSRRVLQVALIGYCLAGALLGVSGVLLSFFLSYMLWGAFQGTIEVAMNTQAISVESSLRRPVMPLFHGSWSLGALIGAAIGTLGVALGIPLSLQLLFLGSLSLLALEPLTKRLLPDEHSDASGQRTPVRSKGRRSGAIRLAILLLCVVALADMLCEGTAADWSAIFLHGSLHSSRVISGLGYTVYSLAMVGMRLGGSRLLGRWPRHRAVPVLTTIATIGFAGGLVANSQIAMLIAFGCLGIGCASVVPVTYSTVGEIPGVATGRAVAIVSGFGWLGFVAGPPIIGEIASVTSLRFALAIVPLLTALITVLFARARVFRQESHRNGAAGSIPVNRVALDST